MMRGDVDILSDQVTESMQDLQPLDVLAIPPSQMGRDSLFCYLAQRGIPRVVVAERDSPVKVHIDVHRSNLIEFWRPYYSANIIREGRFYFQEKIVQGGEFMMKDSEFCEWANKVMAEMRRALPLHKEWGSYVGVYAAEEISAGRLIISK